MKKCPKCAAENIDTAVFCKDCGESLAGVATTAAPAKAPRKYSFFVEQTETVVAELGSNYVQSYLTNGTIQKGFSVVTPKRVYFKGKCYSNINGRWKKLSEERTVDLKDVTGTGYVYIRNVSILLKGLAMLLGSILLYVLIPNVFDDFGAMAALGLLVMLALFVGGVVQLIRFFIKRLTLCEINFAGGRIAFDVKWYPEADAQDFQRQLRLAKDNVAEQEQFHPVAQVPTPAVSGSVADELKKYADLLSQNMITQDEFDKVKQDLLFSKK